jgi:tetratricopeptide (TPR) repeat protein
MIRRRISLRLLLCFCVTLFLFSLLYAAGDSSVNVWEEEEIIPTYLTGDPDPNPMFYRGRAYQGAEGRVYPYPLYDKLTGKKVDKTYTMVYLENEYLKIGILPEIGGRLFSAVDKTNNYNFIYRQHVIKPALIGMLGAWISGGIEWNIPHHHRPTSFLPIQYRIVENDDGRKTVWIGELELRHRTRWVVGYTLAPGKSYLEITIRMLNCTPFVHSILCFANAAVHTNKDYQVLFPPSTQYVTHHAKRQFTTWPIATNRYGGADFDSVDVSWYKNHYWSNSMFAWNYEDDFVGGYDHGKKAGIICVANHHIVPGKKFWTWGNAPYGKMWDNTLTDDDGPYIEFMVGAYSDNQPDYSWMQPYETKDVKQFWYPVRDIGGVKNANGDAAVNLVAGDDDSVYLGFYTTSKHPEAIVQLKANDTIILHQHITISPDKPYSKHIQLPKGVNKGDIRASLSVEGTELVSYSPVQMQPKPMPKPVVTPAPPAEVETIEELYLIGRRIAQFHNPALEPDPYWEEALRRDPGDTRVNTALGITSLKKGMFEKAEQYFLKALDRLTANYTTPMEGEPYYYLGVSLKAQNKFDQAYDAFYKAIWSDAWKAAGYYALAEIACRRDDMSTALNLVNNSLTANALNPKAINLKATILRHLGKREDALELTSTVREIDPLNARALAEQWLVRKDNETMQELLAMCRDYPENALETAMDYGNAGRWQDGTAILLKLINVDSNGDQVSPLNYYYLGYFADNLGKTEKASRCYKRAAEMPIDFVFPFRLEAINILQHAMKTNPNDARAPYYLGNLLFDWQPEKAIELWEKSRSIDASLSIVHRNLALAYSSQENGLDKAIMSLEKAVALEDKYAIHFFELDKLYQAAGVSPEKRLAKLEKNHDVVEQRDDALSREIALKVNMGKYDNAIKLMQSRRFYIWEGGARFNINNNWTDAHLLRGYQHFIAGQYHKALTDYQLSVEFPPNLQTARGRTFSRYPDVAYWIGCAHEALGDAEQAQKFWRESSAQLDLSENDETLPMNSRSILLYYQALSLQKLGQEEKARPIFEKLLKSGEQALKEGEKIDFFAKFGQEQTQRSRLAVIHYITGLGYLGLDEKEKAKQEFIQALEASPDHLWAQATLTIIDQSR